VDIQSIKKVIQNSTEEIWKTKVQEETKKGS
jgi:hypothetical protein